MRALLTLCKDCAAAMCGYMWCGEGICWEEQSEALFCCLRVCMGSSKSVDWDGSCILLLQVLGYHMASTCISVATEHVAVFAVAFIDTSKDPPQCSPWQTSGAKLYYSISSPPSLV